MAQRSHSAQIRPILGAKPLIIPLDHAASIRDLCDKESRSLALVLPGNHWRETRRFGRLRRSRFFTR
eukprot:3029536-Heterocapsa_arctica.AAC.1